MFMSDFAKCVNTKIDILTVNSHINQLIYMIIFVETSIILVI